MTGTAGAALWLALLVAAFGTGIGASRWRDPLGAGPLAQAGWFAAAAAAVAGWGVLAGDLLRGRPIPLLVESLPVAAGWGARLAALWATPPGAAATIAMGCLVAAALAPVTGREAGPGMASRQATVLSGTAIVLLAMALLRGGGVPAASIPAFAQSGAAVVAPLAAAVAATLLLAAAALAAAAAGAGVSPPVAAWQALVLAAFAAATLASGAEQAARATLGIGPRDPVVPGGASAGLVAWLLAAALLHRRARAFFLPGAGVDGSRQRWAGGLAHGGAALVALSFAAHALASRTALLLPPGVAVTATDAFGRPWRVVNQGISRFDAAGADVTALAIEATGPDGRARLLSTELREHPGRGGVPLAPAARRGSSGTPFQQLRVLLESADGTDAARVRVAFVPLAILWPAGLALLTASLLAAALTPRRPRDASSHAS